MAYYRKIIGKCVSQTYRATYSPDDNKLRLYASLRLDEETYSLINKAGFRWAPKQELFVAPAWTPGREDVLLSLAGDIEDEDSTLFDRQEQRAGRFSDYSDRRAVERVQENLIKGGLLAELKKGKEQQPGQ
jgi:hypothetical protein